MESARTRELGTGLFIFLGFAALLFLATQTTDLEQYVQDTGYRVTARFSDVAGLKERAPVTLALHYLAFVFLGKGMYNLQEAGVFAPRPIGWLPDHDVLRELFGFYPLAETLLAQAAFLTLIAATGAFYLIRRRTLAVAVVPRTD